MQWRTVLKAENDSHRMSKIQCAIVGAEGVGIFSRDTLDTADKYNLEEDVLHLNMDSTEEVVHTINSEGC